MKITAVIPVRAGSTRVKNKNIRPFAGSSLLEIKIRQLQSIGLIDKIVVSSDSDEMLALAEKYNVIAKRRPIEYCDEKSKSFNEVVRYIAGNEVDTDVMMWVPCVCPLISKERILQGIQMYRSQQTGDLQGNGVCTATLLKEYIYSENGPINFSIENHVKSQDLPNWHCIINGFFIAKTNEMRDWGFVYGKNPLFCEVDKYEAIDIDDQQDFELAEILYKKKNNLL